MSQDEFELTYDWQKAQIGELKFHLKSKWRTTEAWALQNKILFESWNFTYNQFPFTDILDIGAGPKLRLKYFKDAYIWAIEPLAIEFMKGIAWCDLDDSIVFAKPAEMLIPSLQERFEMAVCINVLDHSQNPQQIIKNAYAYLEMDGTFLVSTDLRTEAEVDDMHPQSFTETDVWAWMKAAGFVIYSTSNGLPMDSESQSGYSGHLPSVTIIGQK